MRGIRTPAATKKMPLEKVCCIGPSGPPPPSSTMPRRQSTRTAHTSLKPFLRHRSLLKLPGHHALFSFLSHRVNTGNIKNRGRNACVIESCLSLITATHHWSLIIEVVTGAPSSSRFLGQQQWCSVVVVLYSLCLE